MKQAYFFLFFLGTYAFMHVGIRSAAGSFFGFKCCSEETPLRISESDALLPTSPEPERTREREEASEPAEVDGSSISTAVEEEPISTARQPRADSVLDSDAIMDRLIGILKGRVNALEQEQGRVNALEQEQRTQREGSEAVTDPFKVIGDKIMGWENLVPDQEGRWHNLRHKGREMNGNFMKLVREHGKRGAQQRERTSAMQREMTLGQIRNDLNTAAKRIGEPTLASNWRRRWTRKSHLSLSLSLSPTLSLSPVSWHSPMSFHHAHSQWAI